MAKHPGSLKTYLAGRKLHAEDWPFYALIQAAMREADTDNEAKLRSVYPEIWDELAARYNAPGGFLENEGG